MEWYLLDEKIKGWLAEDLPYGDVTSDPLFSEDHMCSGTFVAKEDGCIAGLPVAQRVFRVLSEDVVMTLLVEEGSRVAKGTPIANISGPTRDVLKGERLALNLMQRMSGIATMTRKYAASAVPLARPRSVGWPERWSIACNNKPVRGSRQRVRKHSRSPTIAAEWSVPVRRWCSTSDARPEALSTG